MFGQLIARYRQRLALTQEELADRSGLSVRTIRALEACKGQAPRPATARSLANAFGLTGEERAGFIAGTGSSDPPDEDAGSVRPAQVPAQVRGFIGRCGALAALDGLLPGTARDRPEDTTVVTITGTAGVGKTALAAFWAHRVAEHFPDGQLYVDLRGFDRSGSVLEPAVAIRGFLDALAVAPARMPAGLDAQAALYRSLLAGRRLLIVLDNARDAEQVRPLLPGAPGCLVLVTSRCKLVSLVAEGARPVPLDLFGTDEARCLLTSRIDSRRVTAEPEAVDDIVGWCAGLPLALAVVAARAATHPDLALEVLAEELREGRLDAFDVGDLSTDVRAVFSWSYHALSPPAARLFRLLGLHAGADIATAAAASLAGVSRSEARCLLAELDRAHLVMEHAYGRYAMHDLLHSYAAERCVAVDSGDERGAALRRCFDHYLHTAYQAALLLQPHRQPITLEQLAVGTLVEQLADRAEALAWFTAERAVVQSVIRHAAISGFEIHAWQLTWTLMNFLDRQGRWHESAANEQLAIEITGRLGDWTGLAESYRALGVICTRLDRTVEAADHLRNALALYRRLGNLLGQAQVHTGLSYLAERCGQLRTALRHDQRCLGLYQAVGSKEGQARALNAVGWTHAQLGDYTSALEYCRRALDLQQEIGAPPGVAATWDSLGYIYHHLGDHQQAASCFAESLLLYRELGDRYNEADVLTHLGDTHQALHELTAARQVWQRALEILEQLGHHDDNEVRTRLLRLEHPPDHDRDAAPRPVSR